MYQTLQDFTQHAKGVSYLVAGIILVLLVFFWLFLNRKSGPRKD